VLQTSLPALALFDAHCLGWGDYPRDESEVAILIPNWSDMIDQAPELTGPCMLALDRSPGRQTWARADAQRAADGGVHLE
jgi:hypothetical protein